MLATLLGRFHPGFRALTDEIALKLGQCAHDVKHQLAAAGRGVNTVCDTLKMCPLLSQVINQITQETEGTSQPVKRRCLRAVDMLSSPNAEDPDQAVRPRTICFSKTEGMHDLVIGRFINRYEFG